MRNHTRPVTALSQRLQSTQLIRVATALTMLKAFLQELDSAPEVANALLECMLPGIQTGTTHTCLIRRLPDARRSSYPSTAPVRCRRGGCRSCIRPSVLLDILTRSHNTPP
jgi:hypothetical protein